MREAIKDWIGYLKSEPLIAFMMFLVWQNYNLNQRLQASQDCRISDLVKGDSVKVSLSIDAKEGWRENSKSKDKIISILGEKIKNDTLK